MVYEFEGRTEKEAIDRAAEELGLQKDDFDVEILETQRSGLFKKGYVKIQVHTNQNRAERGVAENEDDEDGRVIQKRDSGGQKAAAGKWQISQSVFGEPEPKNEFEKQMIEFVEGLIERMGYGGKVTILFREDQKI